MFRVVVAFLLTSALLTAELVAADVPASQPATRPAEARGSAIGTIRQLADDLDTVIGRGHPDKAEIDACFGNLHNKTFTFTGSAFGPAPAPFPGHKQSVLVTLSVPPPKAIEEQWRKRFAATRDKYDTQEKKMLDDHRVEQASDKYQKKSQDQKNQIENDFKNNLADLQRKREAEVAADRAIEPKERTVDLFLLMPDGSPAEIKRGQIVRGTITFQDGTAESREWRIAGETAEPAARRGRGRRGRGRGADPEVVPTYADKIQLLASLEPGQ